MNKVLQTGFDQATKYSWLPSLPSLPRTRSGSIDKMPIRAWGLSRGLLADGVTAYVTALWHMDPYGLTLRPLCRSMHATARADSSTSLARFRKQIAAMVNASLTTQFRPIDARSAWKSSQYTGNKDWLVTLKQQHLDELRAAVTLHKNVSEAQLHELRTSDFPLPTLGPVLHEVRDETVQGRGFAVVQGLPTRDYSPR